MASFPVLLALNITLLVVFAVNQLVWILFDSNMVFLSIETDPVMMLSMTDARHLIIYTDINLPQWTFSLNGVVCIWQLIWVIYSLCLICKMRKISVVFNPALIKLFILAGLLQLGLKIASLFSLELGFTLLVLLSLILHVSLRMSYIALYAPDPSIQILEEADDTYIRVFIHNGVALYATWVSTLTVFNMAIVIAFGYAPVSDQRMASTFSLVCFAALSAACVARDLSNVGHISRLVISPYLVRFWVLLGLVSNFTDSEVSVQNVIFIIVLLVFALVTLLFKVQVIRKRRLPVCTTLKETKEKPISEF